LHVRRADHHDVRRRDGHEDVAGLVVRQRRAADDRRLHDLEQSWVVSEHGGVLVTDLVHELLLRPPGGGDGGHVEAALREGTEPARGVVVLVRESLPRADRLTELVGDLLGGQQAARLGADNHA
jgi:hypothetical protein